MEARMEYMKWLKNRLLSEEERVYLRTIGEDEAQIQELFGSDLSFDGNVLIGPVGVGTSRFNNYQLSRGVQAFSNNLIRKAGGRVGKGVAIAYDTRKNGAHLAESAARVLLGNGIATALFPKPRSLEQLSFAVRYLDLEGGIMVTAGSEAEDKNGLVLLDDQGAPLSPDEMKDVSREFRGIQGTDQIHPYVAVMRLNSIHRKIGISNDTKFMQEILAGSSVGDIDTEWKIVYSPLQGTGGELIPSLLQERGFTHVFVVTEEMPGENGFDQVASMDVQDEKNYERALVLAKEQDADMILLTDADCQGIGMALKLPHGEFKILTREQMNHQWEAFRAEVGAPTEPPKVLEIPGPGTALMLAEMAAYYQKKGEPLGERV